MGAYNRTNGEPCCGSRRLLSDILRNEWGFDGHVVSDCWAIKDFHEHHGVTANPIESVSLAMNNGCDLNCGSLFLYLEQAVSQILFIYSCVKAVALILRTTMYRKMFGTCCRLQIILIVSLQSHNIAYTKSACQIGIFSKCLMPSSPSRIAENIDIWRPESQSFVNILVVPLLLHCKLCPCLCGYCIFKMKFGKNTIWRYTQNGIGSEQK